MNSHRLNRRHLGPRLTNFTAAVVAVGLTSQLANLGSAGPPLVAAGTYTAAYVDTLIRTAGGNSFFAEVGSGFYDGDLQGTFADSSLLIVHSDGSFESHGTEIGTSCTLGGRSGNFTATYSLTGSVDPFQYSGTFTFTDGTGGLSGLTGGGTFRVDETSSIYSYQYRFAP